MREDGVRAREGGDRVREGGVRMKEGEVGVKGMRKYTRKNLTDNTCGEKKNIDNFHLETTGNKTKKNQQ